MSHIGVVKKKMVDCLEMVQNRHPHIAHSIFGLLPPVHQGIWGQFKNPGTDRGGVVQVPSWEDLAAGLRPEDVDMEPEPSQPKHGWQKFTSVTIQNVHRESTWSCQIARINNSTFFLRHIIYWRICCCLSCRSSVIKDTWQNSDETNFIFENLQFEN